MDYGFPINDSYFDRSSRLTIVPSYVWYNADNERLAFVLNVETKLYDNCLGIKIKGYQTVTDDITFSVEILPYVVKHLMIFNKERGFPYDYLYFDDVLALADNTFFKEKTESLGFSYNREKKRFIVSINNERVLK